MLLGWKSVTNSGRYGEGGMSLAQVGGGGHMAGLQSLSCC